MLKVKMPLNSTKLHSVHLSCPTTLSLGCLSEKWMKWNWILQLFLVLLITQFFIFQI